MLILQIDDEVQWVQDFLCVVVSLEICQEVVCMVMEEIKLLIVVVLGVINGQVENDVDYEDELVQVDIDVFFG